jgi:hypothetical protein
MTKKQATTEATEIANRDRIRMVVTENPYAENEDETFGYCPAAAASIFKYEKVLETIEPGEIT